MKTDQEKISYALNVWANYIETGDVTLCAADAKHFGVQGKTLNKDQLALVKRLRELAALATTGRMTVLPSPVH